MFSRELRVFCAIFWTKFASVLFFYAFPSLAVSNDNIEGLKLLLDFQTIDVNIVANDGRSALHVAVLNRNNTEPLKLVLTHPGLSALTINQKDIRDEATPVMRAVLENRLEHLALLGADLRVDLDTTDWHGRNLKFAARSLEARQVLEEAEQKREENRK